jgi:hypothetical protein
MAFAQGNGCHQVLTFLYSTISLSSISKYQDINHIPPVISKDPKENKNEMSQNTQMKRPSVSQDHPITKNRAL